MANFTKNGYRPRPFDIVKGMSGGRVVVGQVMPHPKHPASPFVFKSVTGAVLCFVWDGERRRACYELEPLESVKEVVK